MTQDLQAMDAQTMQGTQDTREAVSPDDPGAQRALRGVFAATLTMEAMVVLLAIAPLAALGNLPGWGIAALTVLGISLVVLAGFLRQSWAYPVGTVLQVLVVLTGFFHPAMFVLGGAFLAIWLYELRLRAKLAAGTLRRPASPAA